MNFDFSDLPVKKVNESQVTPETAPMAQSTTGTMDFSDLPGVKSITPSNIPLPLSPSAEKGNLNFSDLQQEAPPPVDPFKQEKDKFKVWYDTLKTQQPDIGSEPPEDLYGMYKKASSSPMPLDVFVNEVKGQLSTFNKANYYGGQVEKVINDFAPWVGAVALAPEIGIPAAAAAFTTIQGAKDIVDRETRGKSIDPETGLWRLASGVGSWIDPRPESEMSQQALIARDALNNLSQFLGWEVAPGLIKKGYKASKSIISPAFSGAKDLGAAALNEYPTIKAGLLEAQTWAKKPAEWWTELVTDPAWTLAVKTVNAKILPTTEKMFAHGQSESIMVKKSIADIMQPAIERLSDTTQDVFRSNTVLKSKLTNWGQELGGILSKETDPLVRHEIAKGIRGTPISELTTDRAKEVISQHMPKLSDMNMTKKNENAFRESISKSIGERLEAPENVFTGEEFKNTLRPISEKVAEAKVYKFLDAVTPQSLGVGKFSFPVRPKSTTEVLQQGLKDLIEDPTVSYEIQTAAKDLFNLPATLPAEVYKAANSLTNSLLTKQLMKTPGMVLHDKPEKVVQELKDILKEGGLTPKSQQQIIAKIKAIEGQQYLPSTWKPFIKSGKSQWVQRDAELELKAMALIPDLANRTYNKYFMGPWKMSKAILRPAALMRNGFTNEMLNHMGGLPFWRQDIYLKALQGMKGSENKFLGQSLNQHFKDLTGIYGTPLDYSLNDLAQVQQLKYGSNVAEKALHGWDTLTKPAITLYSAMEQHAKFAKYLHNLERGLGQKEAAMDAMKWTFNYGEITRATARVRTYAAPFFTWQSKVFPLFAESIIKNPIKWTGAIMLYHGIQNAAIEQAGMSKGEWEEFNTQLPDYLNSGMMFPMPWRDSQGRLNLLDLTYIVPGFGDAYQMSGHPYSQFFQHPLVSIAGGLQNNKKFSGAPIYYEWDDSATKASKSMAYIWENLVPAPLPGGTDFNMMKQAMWDTPRSEFEPIVTDKSRMQALAGFFGGKVTPVDESTTISNAQNLRAAKVGEVNAALKGMLRRARTEKERNQLIEKYYQNLQEVQNVGQE